MDILIIAHFITEFVKDGTSRFIYIAEQLNKQHNVELITSGFDHIAKKQRTAQEYELKSKITMLKEPSYPKNVCLKRFYSHAIFGKKLKKYLESRKKPDIIYCAVPSLDGAFYAAKYAKKNNIKFIIDVQDLWPEAFKMVFKLPIISDLVFYPMMRKANYIYSCADTIVGVSETYCKRATAVNRKNAECIPVFLGTKLESFDKYAEENKVIRDDDNFVIGYCGTLGHSYDIKCVIDALVLLKKEGISNIFFWIMGDGPLKNEFEKYAKENQIDAVFYGRVSYPKMCGLLVSCDACINPIIKGAAQSIINKHGDYAASGLPVINTQPSDEYRSLIEHYNCGINCECSNSICLADAINHLMNNRDECAIMGGNSRILAETMFDRNFSYEKIYRLFR